MSKQAMEAILGRCVMAEDFRDLLFAEPDRALAGYELTRAERAALLAVDAETLEAFAAQLGVHMARGGAGKGRNGGLPME